MTMKKPIILAALMAFALVSCESNKTEKNESDEVTVASEVDETPTGNFGESITEDQAVSLNQLVAELENKDKFEGKVYGEIKEVCTHKGCWMTLDLPNGETMRVTFKDYGFFVPKNSHGLPVVIEGVAKKSMTDVETLRHYAEDAGKSQEEIKAINAPKQEYAFEATGVIIKENA